MPLRPLIRELTWLFPPTLEELLPMDHPARFAAAFVGTLDRASWSEMEIAIDGDPLGAPAYDPRAVLCVWVYGFMTGVRSSRKLEAACRDQIPYLWLTGWQHPDHNTLWKFYQAHREQMRKLFKHTVRVAVKAGLVDLAVQAVDGTKVKGNAAKERTYDQANLEKLLERTEEAIKDLEAQNEGGTDPAPARLPQQLAAAKALQEQVAAALEAVTAEDGPKQRNLTDPDAQLMKGRQGFVAGYNAQAMVSPLDAKAAGRTGLLITAADLSTEADDHAALLPMIAQARENIRREAEWTLADGGYHSGPNLVACTDHETQVVMPEAQKRALANPYHKDAFSYDAKADAYQCPKGQVLPFVGTRRRKGREGIRVYRGTASVCRACPAFGVCTKNRRHGRILEVGPEELVLRKHRSWMATEEAKAHYQHRKELPEPTFGILKEQQGARGFLLRGLAAVRAEWLLLATAFNLRTLYRVWQARAPTGRLALAGL